jgi:hypothetical protein
MDYNFEDFLEQSKASCKTKSDFIKKISREEESVSKIQGGPDFLDKQLYLKRLSNAKFCAEHRVIKEKDKFDNDLLELLDRLQ